MEEIWKKVKGNETYEVSNYGNVRSIDRYVSRNGCTVFIKGKLLEQSSVRGYKRVTLYYGSRNVKKQIFVHRLVAENFIENPNCHPYINHKDENKLNNCSDNLEWCTAKYNSNYGTSIKRRVEHQDWQSIADKQSKEVIQKDLNGNEIARYKSTMDAQRHGYNSPSVCKCCNGYLKTYKGYVFEYESIRQRKKSINNRRFY